MVELILNKYNTYSYLIMHGSQISNTIKISKSG
jgi:hypothetical protein